MDNKPVATFKNIKSDNESVQQGIDVLRMTIEYRPIFESCFGSRYKIKSKALWFIYNATGKFQGYIMGVILTEVIKGIKKFNADKENTNADESI